MSKHKKYILVCDDDAGIVDVATLILEEQGYEVATASRGEEVLTAIQDPRPDLVILDLWMPGITGDKITQRLKQNSDTASIPVIIFSANRDTQKIATEVGANACISKPFDISELEEKVAQLLNPAE